MPSTYDFEIVYQQVIHMTPARGSFKPKTYATAATSRTTEQHSWSLRLACSDFANFGTTWRLNSFAECTTPSTHPKPTRQKMCECDITRLRY